MGYKIRLPNLNVVSWVLRQSTTNVDILKRFCGSRQLETIVIERSALDMLKVLIDMYKINGRTGRVVNEITIIQTGR